jgi:signal transduction histidine kinase
VATGDDQRDAGASDASLKALSDFLRAERDEILSRAENALRALPPADPGFDPEAILDALPRLLDCVGEMSDPLAAGAGVVVSAAEGDPHRGERPEQAFDLRVQVVALVLLRDAMLGLVFQRGRPGGANTLVRLLNQAVDRAIGTAVLHFTAARDRTWRALERLAQVSLQAGATPGLDEVLRRLLQAFLEAATAVDSVSLYVREGDGRPHLRLRAAAGLEEPLVAATPVVVAWGEGFAGSIAERRVPLTVRWAARDPLVTSEPMRRHGVRALHGVPLIEGSRLVGVALMGSLTTFELSETDRRLFNALAAQATTAIVERLLRDDAADAVATVCHDLRGPLGVIQMQAGLLEGVSGARSGAGVAAAGASAGASEDPATGKVPARARSILRAADRMSRLIRDLTDYANLNAGRLAIAPRPEVPAELMREVIDNLAPLAQERGVTLRAEVSPDLPGLSCDRGRLCQVLSSLIGNAIEGSAPGASVSVRAEPEGGGVVFSVEDEAPGGANARRRPGALTLAVARGIVEAHGGRIWAVNAADDKSTFCFALPAVRA